MLYVRPDLHPMIRPVVISHGFGAGCTCPISHAHPCVFNSAACFRLPPSCFTVTSEFIWDGCRDYTAMLVVPYLVAFWNHVGLDRARAYCTSLLRDACTMLCDAWRSSTQAPTEFYSHMALVELPAPTVQRIKEYVGDSAAAGPASSTHAKAMQDFLYSQHIECPVKCLDGKLFVRISAMVYNQAEGTSWLSRVP